MRTEASRRGVSRTGASRERSDEAKTDEEMSRCELRIVARPCTHRALIEVVDALRVAHEVKDLLSRPESVAFVTRRDGPAWPTRRPSCMRIAAWILGDVGCQRLSDDRARFERSQHD